MVGPDRRGGFRAAGGQAVGAPAGDVLFLVRMEGFLQRYACVWGSIEAEAIEAEAGKTGADSPNRLCPPGGATAPRRFLQTDGRRFYANCQAQVPCKSAKLKNEKIRDFSLGNGYQFCYDRRNSQIAGRSGRCRVNHQRRSLHSPSSWAISNKIKRWFSEFPSISPAVLSKHLSLSSAPGSAVRLWQCTRRNQHDSQNPFPVTRTRPCHF